MRVKEKGSLPGRVLSRGTSPLITAKASGLAGWKISLLAYRIFSRVPTCSMWESPMLVMSTTSGSTRAER